ARSRRTRQTRQSSPANVPRVTVLPALALAPPASAAEAKGGGKSVSFRKRGARGEGTTVRKIAWLCVALLRAGAPLAGVRAAGWRKDSNQLDVINRRLQGKVVDYTANHGVDNRIWSRSLYQRRDLYVYLPPHFDPNQQYPLMIWMHGFAQDEQSFLEQV